jgi:HAMP domain-containing protein
MSPGQALPLRDIHLPPPPGWWPPAPGWWLLAALALVLLWLATRWLLRRWRLRRARRRLLAASRALALAHPPERDPLGWLAGASELLRRAVREHAPQALPLQGEAWLRFLDGDLPGAPFSAGPGRLLLDGPYRPALDAGAVAPLPALLRARLLQLPEPAR